MSYEEAIKSIKETLGDRFYDCVLDDKAGELAINALERQVPKEPVINDKRDNEVDWECPMCGLNVVEEEPYDNYCMRCGQRIDSVSYTHLQ